MPAEAAQNVEALAAQAQRLMATFMRAGYEQIAPAIIQPAGLFLDVVGEALRARTYVFSDPDGEELCLRPDLTVPTCRLHLARHPTGNARARYCYSGPAFRYQPGGATSAHPSEFRQAGIESFAAGDREEDDAAVLALIVEALEEAGIRQFRLRLGDLGLFAALLDALAMPQRWRRRLRHHFWRPEAFRAELARLTSREALKVNGLPQALVDALDPARPQEAQRLVEAHLEAAGLELVGSRTLPEITDRLLAEAADAREEPLAATTAALIEGYTGLKSPAREAADRIEVLIRPHKLDLGLPSRPSGAALSWLRLQAWIRRRPPLRPSSVATSNTTRASCSRSSRGSLAPAVPSPAAVATTACSPTSALRRGCRPSARPSTPSGC